MPTLYYSEFVDGEWSEWDGGFILPPLPMEFDEESTTITFAFRAGQVWCYAYDPEQAVITWCVWDGDEWTDWEESGELPPAPNWIVDGMESYFSVSTHEDMEWVFSCNPEDCSIYWSPWSGYGFGDWEGPVFFEDPPNFDDNADLFVAGDGDKEWLLSVNEDDMSVCFVQLSEVESEEWSETPEPVWIPEEWLGAIDLDGAGRNGQFWLFVTVHDDP